MSMYTPCLPQEMWDYIIDLVPESLDNRSSQVTLLALCLTCRAFKTRSQQNLYRAPCVFTPAVCAWLGGTFGTFPTLSRCLTNLAIDGRRWPTSTVDDIFGKISLNLPHVMKTCRNIQRLTIHNFSIKQSCGYDLFPYPIDCEPCPSLQELIVQNCDFGDYYDLVALFCAAPSLHSLTMTDVRVATCSRFAPMKLNGAEMGIYDVYLSDSITSFIYHNPSPSNHPCLDRHIILSSAPCAHRLTASVISVEDRQFLEDLAYFGYTEDITLSVSRRLQGYSLRAAYGLSSSDNFKSPLRIGSLLSLALKELPFDVPFQGPLGAKCASEVILHLSSRVLRSITLCVPDEPGTNTGDLWPGFNWTAVDRVLASKHFPELMEVVVRRGSNIVTLSVVRSGIRKDDEELVTEVQRRLPKLSQRFGQ
ncbi:hypothetical protein PUNSTDRAFT_138411 [Punctularia strigosozonata HHB-11173 SS5]|uniref:F-box domain-containing protein n=1 Tax=Punctularia strigosozonata (strain HHB-11173) TaxID=741275 RepID=R7S4K4_PUNST|nr:uncharacterized protein PUNSTDRAFT_138411 [Punctularia strigosozonata HHB-11173 SS5]EIN04769.1 hypothetical protein PUNSTDRAFT_138411 [Punctularia strigosozonata HHB-11173 SS5]